MKTVAIVLVAAMSLGILAAACGGSPAPAATTPSSASPDSPAADGDAGAPTTRKAGGSAG